MNYFEEYDALYRLDKKCRAFMYGNILEGQDANNFAIEILQDGMKLDYFFTEHLDYPEFPSDRAPEVANELRNIIGRTRTLKYPDEVYDKYKCFYLWVGRARLVENDHIPAKILEYVINNDRDSDVQYIARRKLRSMVLY